MHGMLLSQFIHFQSCSVYPSIYKWLKSSAFHRRSNVFNFSDFSVLTFSGIELHADNSKFVHTTGNIKITYLGQLHDSHSNVQSVEFCCTASPLLFWASSTLLLSPSFSFLRLQESPPLLYPRSLPLRPTTLEGFHIKVKLQASYLFLIGRAHQSPLQRIWNKCICQC